MDLIIDNKGTTPKSYKNEMSNSLSVTEAHKYFLCLDISKSLLKNFSLSFQIFFLGFRTRPLRCDFPVIWSTITYHHI